MKKTRLFFIPLFLFLFCGCTAKVNLIVTMDQKVEEKMEIAIAQQYINAYFSSLTEFKQNYRNILNTYSQDYTFKATSKRDEIISTVKSKSQIDSFGVNGLDALLFQDVQKIDDKYVFQFSDQLKDLLNPNLEMEVDENELLKEIEIHIQFHNKVLESNSDSSNSRTNTYTWFINKENVDTNIEFVITKEKRYDIIVTYFIKKYFGVIFMGIFILVLAIFAILIVRKSKRENAI